MTVKINQPASGWLRYDTGWAINFDFFFLRLHVSKKDAPQDESHVAGVHFYLPVIYDLL